MRGVTISAAEWEVMRVLWKAGRAMTSREIIDALEGDSDWQPKTIRTLVNRLTEKGAELLPVVVGLRQWGERWGIGIPSTPVLVDKRDEQPIRPIRITAHDKRELGLADLCWKQAADIRPLEEPVRAAIAA